MFTLGVDRGELGLVYMSRMQYETISCENLLYVHRVRAEYKVRSSRITVSIVTVIVIFTEIMQVQGRRD